MPIRGACYSEVHLEASWKAERTFSSSGLAERMNRPLALTRILFSAATMLLVAAFVHAYSTLQSNMLQHAYKLDLSCLPLPTTLYLHYPWLGYILAVGAMAMPLIKCKTEERESAAREILARALGFLALLWSLGCLVAWQLPHYVPAAFID